MDSLLWIDKYKPTKLSEIIGNTNLIKKADLFLNHKPLLFSGSSGTGRTILANILAEKYNYKVKFLTNSKEFKKVLGHSKLFKTKIIIIIELSDITNISDITKIIKEPLSFPVICICNDVDMKLKTLAKYTEHLKFRKPTLKQIQPYINNIIKLEKINISSKVVDKLIKHKLYDIRQILITLQFLNKSNKKIKYDSKTKEIIRSQDINVDMWHSTPLIFNEEIDISQKLDYYFSDNFMIPLMIQQHYLKVSKSIDDIALASEYISDGDIIDTFIKQNQRFELMPCHGMLSTVIPASICHGKVGFIQFPVFLGKMSSIKSKNSFIRDLKNINRESLDLVAIKLSKPLLNRGKDGIDEVIEFMEYLEIDIDNYKKILEFYPEIKILTKIKSALTRAFNKKSRAMSGACKSEPKA